VAHTKPNGTCKENIGKLQSISEWAHTVIKVLFANLHPLVFDVVKLFHVQILGFK
jgi:hypothetical protein